MKSASVILPIVLLTACASTKPYNPYNISGARLTEVSQVCQTAMGFQPSEPLRENLWPGDPDPALETNDYRGCVASLSDSLLDAAVVRNDKLADDKCRASGLKPGSGTFGVCVVNASGGELQPLQDPAPVVITSSGETHRGAQVACAEIGLEPGQTAFSSCVDRLRRTLIAKRMDQDYSN